MMNFSPDSISLVKEISSEDNSIYLSKLFDNVTIAFRLPPNDKISRLQTLIFLSDSLSEINDIYEAIFQEYVIDSSILNYGDIPAGILETIVKLMFYLSANSDIENSVLYSNSLIEQLRTKISTSPIDVMKKTICVIFPGYTIKDLDKLDVPELYRIYVNAEQIGIKRGIIEEELQIRIKGNEEQNQESFSDVIKTTNRELYDIDNRNERANIKDTERWQKSYTNTANRLSKTKR